MRFARAPYHFNDFNNRKKFLTATIWYINLRKSSEILLSFDLFERIVNRLKAMLHSLVERRLFRLNDGFDVQLYIVG